MSVFVHRNVGKVYLTAIILGEKGNLNDWWQTICPQTGKNTKNTIDQCYSAFYLYQRFSHIFFFYQCRLVLYKHFGNFVEFRVTMN